PMVRVGYGQIRQERATPMNVAVQQNLDRAVIGTYPDFSVDYASVRISEGRLTGGGTVSAQVDTGVLAVSWSTEINEMMGSNADDRVYIVLFQPEIDEFMSTPTVPRREDGEVDIVIPEHFLGGTGHVWIFF